VDLMVFQQDSCEEEDGEGEKGREDTCVIRHTDTETLQHIHE